jgi:hypothetical protein
MKSVWHHITEAVLLKLIVVIAAYHSYAACARRDTRYRDAAFSSSQHQLQLPQFILTNEVLEIESCHCKHCIQHRGKLAFTY